MTMRIRALLLLVLLALPAAAGCGEDAADVGPLAAAAERTANEDSVRFFLVMDVDTRAEGEFRMEGTGVATADHSRGRFSGALVMEGEKLLRMEMISIRDEFWIRSEAFDLPPGKRWMHSVDKQVAPKTMTMRELVELIRQSGDVQAVGAERVRGRGTTHYRARVAFRDVLENSPEETRERFEDRFESSGLEDLELPIEVWIDGEDLVRRVDIDIAIRGESVRIRMEMLEYGVEVDTRLPPPAQVAEESEVLP